MFLSGMPLQLISNTLKAEKTSVFDKSFFFSKAMVPGIRKNEKYCGDYIDLRPYKQLLTNENKTRMSIMTLPSAR